VSPKSETTRANPIGEKFPRILPKVATSTSLLGSFTCRKFTIWERRLYFPSEGRRALDFFAWKIRRLRPDFNSRTRVPEASTLTSRPPKPLSRNIVRMKILDESNKWTSTDVYSEHSGGLSLMRSFCTVFSTKCINKSVYLYVDLGSCRGCMKRVLTLYFARRPRSIQGVPGGMDKISGECSLC